MQDNKPLTVKDLIEILENECNYSDEVFFYNVQTGNRQQVMSDSIDTSIKGQLDINVEL